MSMTPFVRKILSLKDTAENRWPPKDAEFLIRYTPNWGVKDDVCDFDYDSITITVKILCNGRGMKRRDAAKMAAKLERVAQGKSKTREVSAII